MTKPILEISQLSKQYRIGVIGTGTMSHDINRWWHKVRGKSDPYLKIGVTNDRTVAGGSYVWALKNFSLNVQPGEVLGIIGKNGAGKSTLLKILSRITLPSSGHFISRGRIASLLEVGTGFHPELTGKENIYLNGAILGMSKSEIKSKFDEIVDFAGVSKYIGTPVKRYSSGMTVRLGFAVAAHLEPEILVVDEVLAVGDIEFQKKAIGKIKQVSKGEGRTVLFVSHNMASVRSICSKSVLLENGEMVMMDNTPKVIESYLQIDPTGEIRYSSEFLAQEIKSQLEGNFSARNFISIQKISLLNSKNEQTSEFHSDELIKIQFEILANFDVDDFRIVITILDKEGCPFLVTQLHDSDSHQGYVPKGDLSVLCEFPSNFFGNNDYVLNLQFIHVKNQHFNLNGLVKFRVKYNNPKYNNYGQYESALVRPQFNWTFL